MNRRRFVITGISAAAIAACSSSQAGRFSPSVLTQEGEALLAGGKRRAYTLTVQYAVTRFANGVRLRGRTYNGTTVGPSMVVQPGDTLAVRMINKLPRNPQVTQARHQLVPQPQTMMEAMNPHFRGTFRPAEAVNEMNNPHDFNTTNLHVHGIQTIPHIFEPLGTSNPSAPMVAIEPGKTYDYAFPIPLDHPSGLHWYHPHHHGSTDVQVSNGMAGLIYVRGPIDEVPEIKAARDITLVVQTLDVNENKKTGLYEREYIAYRSPQNGGYFLSTDYTMMTVTTLVNGVPKRSGSRAGRYWIGNNAEPAATYTAVDALPSFNVAPGEVIRLRFLNGTNYYTLPLVLPGFSTYAIGFDGVNLLEAQRIDMSGKNTKTIRPENLLKAPAMIASAGNRVEFLIKAPSTPGAYTLSSLANEHLYFRPVPTLDLAQFVVQGPCRENGHSGKAAAADA